MPSRQKLAFRLQKTFYDPFHRLIFFIVEQIMPENKSSCSEQNPLTPQNLQPGELLPGKYRHYKGKDYEVFDVATHSEDESLYVVYLT